MTTRAGPIQCVRRSVFLELVAEPLEIAAESPVAIVTQARFTG
jgi:hypothetical protein